MSNGDIIPPTPQQGGDEKSAADKPGDKHGDQIGKKRKPRKAMSKRGNITWAQFIDLGGTGLVLWVWSETVKTHDVLILVFLGFTLTIFQSGPAHFLYSLTKKFRWAFVCSFSLWIALVIATWGVVWANSRPLMEDKPHLKLLLTTTDLRGGGIILTNDFLFRTLRLNTNGALVFDNNICGYLLIPITSPANMPEVRFLVFNDSKIASAKSAIIFELDTQMAFEATGWSPMVSTSRQEEHWHSVGMQIDPLWPSGVAHTGIGLPAIKLKPDSSIINTKAIPCLVRIESQENDIIAFWILIATTSAPRLPELIYSTNGVIRIPN